MGTVLGRISVETPRYRILAKEPDYEIREYEACLAAEVSYDPSHMNRGRDGGFAILADYIGALGKPHNTVRNDLSHGAEGEKIAMTAPVITHQKSANSVAGAASDGGAELVTMQFILPSKYNMENVPVPSDPRVSVKELPKRKYGVITFSGVADDALVQTMLQRLRKSLENGGYRVIGDSVLARYNPPWTLPFLRTNEIMLPVE